MDDLNLEISLIYEKALAGLKKFATELDKSTTGSKKLKDGLGAVNKTLKEVGKETNKLVTQENKLNTVINEQKQKLVDIQNKHRSLTAEILKAGKATDAQSNKLKKLTSDFVSTSTAIKNNTAKLRENEATMRRASTDANSLSMAQARLKAAYNATTRAEKMQSASMRASARRASAFQSAGAAMGRAGPTKGGLISAGAALGAGGMVHSGASLIGVGAAIGGGAALFNAAKTGMTVDRLLTETITRPGPDIDREELRAAIKKATAGSMFNVTDVAKTFLAVRNAADIGLGEISGVAQNALLFGQSENLDPEDATNKLVGASTILGRSLDAKGTRYTANLMSAAASITKDKASDYYTALTSAGKELKEYGHLSDEELMAVLAVQAQSGFGGSKASQLRTTVLSNKDTPKVTKLIDKIQGLTGERLNMTDQAGNMLPLLDVLESISSLDKKNKGNPVVGEYIRKLVSTAFGARGTSKIQALINSGDREYIRKLSEQIKSIAKSDIIKKLGEARLGTTEGKLGASMAQLSSTMETLFVTTFQAAFNSVFDSMREDLINLTTFLDKNKGFTEAFTKLLVNVFGGIREIAKFTGGILVRLMPTLSVLSEILNLLRPIFGLLNFGLGLLDLVFSGIKWVGGMLGGMIGWLTGWLAATLKWIGHRVVDAVTFGGKSKEIDAQYDLDKENYTEGGQKFGKRVGEVAAPFAVGVGISGAAKAFGALAPEAATATGLNAITKGMFTSAQFVGRHPIVTGLLASGLGNGSKGPDNVLTDSLPTGYGVKKVTNTFNITIDGAKNPEEIAKAIQKHFEKATFSNYMEAPIY